MLDCDDTAVKRLKLMYANAGLQIVTFHNLVSVTYDLRTVPYHQPAGIHTKLIHVVSVIQLMYLLEKDQLMFIKV